MTVLAYVAAVAAANLSAATFGPVASVANALLFIGFDLTLRDRLHDSWAGRGLWWRMAGVIAAGGVVSWAVNRNAGEIALASTAAFVVASALDAVAYGALGRRGQLLRINGSNVVGATADSLIFPTLAFGSLMPAIVVGQFAAKVIGGFVWSLVLAVPVRRQAS